MQNSEPTFVPRAQEEVHSEGTKLVVGERTHFGGRTRLNILDVVRGIALCGIAFPNAVVMWRMERNLAQENAVANVLELFFQQRFFPIFSVLFGIGFGMLWAIAQKRTDRPRLALLRRMALLLAIGVVHQLLQPGEALAPYAIAGLVVLIPLTFIPEKWLHLVSLGLGLIMLAASVFVGGGLASIPGLFAIGFGLALIDFPRTLEGCAKTSFYGFAVTAPVAAVACIWHYLKMKEYHDAIAAIQQEALLQGAPVPSNALLQMSATVAGIMMAVAYIFFAAALMHTPLRKVLIAVFSPLGRMSLTNYVVATLLFLFINANIGLSSRDGSILGALTGGELLSEHAWLTAFALIGAVLATQWALSLVWFHVFNRKQGPLEFAWRRFTWWK